MKTKQFKNYKNLGLFFSSDHASHPIFQLEGKHSTWFFKQIATSICEGVKDDIESEVIVQEFMRLILPRQPKTRALISCDMEPSGILSKAVSNFRSFGSMNSLMLIYRVLFGEITGLGEISTMLLHLCEEDAKLDGNIGADVNNEAVKLDGHETQLARRDFEFAQRHPLTMSDISNLPRPPAYVNSNWLNNNSDGPYSSLWFLMSFNARFHLEVNRTLLKLIVLPDIFIEQLIHNNSTRSDYIKIAIIAQFIERKKILKEQALQIPSFISFIADDNHQTELEKFAANLKEFTLPGSVKLMSLCGDFEQTMTDEFTDLQDYCINAKKEIFNNRVKMGLFLVLATLIGLIIKFTLLPPESCHDISHSPKI